MRSIIERRLAIPALLAMLAAGQAAAAGMEDHVLTFFELDQLEYRMRDGADAVAWHAQGWVGGDSGKLWLKAEGERPLGEDFEKAEFQLLYGRPVSDFFDLQAGVRFDAEPQPRRGFAVIGLQGLAPHFIELDTAAFVSHKGEFSARLEAEYDLAITQRLVLQPALEVNLSAQRVAAREIGPGVTDIELGARLRYEVMRELAPYLGVHWERKLGETAEIAGDHGEDPGSLSLVGGVRLWF